MELVDEVIGSCDTPVVCDGFITTGNGLLVLSSAVFKGRLPDNDMPPSIALARVGGNAPTVDIYIHAEEAEDRIETLEQSRDMAYRENVRLRAEVRDFEERTGAMQRQIRDLMWTCQQYEVATTSISIKQRIKHFFRC